MNKNPQLSGRACAAMALAMALALTVAGALLVMARPAAAQTPAAAATACAPDGDLHFVCNLISVEDFLPVNGGRWLVGGSYVEKSVGLYLIDTKAKTAKPMMLSLAAVPDPLYAGCAAPDLKNLQTHGLDVKVINGHASATPGTVGASFIIEGVLWVLGAQALICVIARGKSE